MQVVAEIINKTKDTKVLLSDTPLIIPTINYARYDKLELKCKVINDSKRPISCRIEFWVGNDIIASKGRDIPSHVSEIEDIIQPGDYSIKEKFFSVIPRDDNATILIGTQFNYSVVFEHIVRLVYT